MKLNKLTAIILKLVIVLCSIPAFAQDSSTTIPGKDWSVVSVWGSNQLNQAVFLTLQIAGAGDSLLIEKNSPMHSLGISQVKAGTVSYFTNLPPSQDVICGELPQQKLHLLRVTAYREHGVLKCDMQYR